MSADAKPLVLGTAGHVDHGKTELIRALTGVDTDRWEEEKRRGITIDLGFAPFPSPPDLAIAVVDVPGHEDFVRNMLSGASGIDLVLLVVAADEGPMPQTREHLAIVSLLGLRRGVLAVTKADLVDGEGVALALDLAREEVRAAVGADWPAVAVSAPAGRGIDELRGAIVEVARATPARRADDLFRLPVDRSFSLRGAGTVVTGSVWSGRATRDTELTLLPSGRPARIRGIHVHGAKVSEARAGFRAALALAGLDRREVGRGDVLVASPAAHPTRLLDVELALLGAAARPLRSHQRVRVHLGTDEVMGRAVLLETRECSPGGSALAQLRLERPLVARSGDRFVLRFYSPVSTIGGGRVLDPAPRRRARVDAEEARLLRSLAAASPAARLQGLARLAGLEGVGSDEATWRVGLTPDEARAARAELVAAGGLQELAGRAYDPKVPDAVEARLLAAVQAHHEADPTTPGIPLESLRAAGAGRHAHAPADAVLQRLVADGRIEQRGAVAARPDFAPTLDPRRAALGDRIAARLRAAGLSPPDVGELAGELGKDVLPVLKFLAREGVLVPVSPDLYFDADTLAAARGRVEAFLRDREPAGPGDLKAVLDISRKYLIPILEWLDREGVTRRTAEGRQLRTGVPS